MKSVRTAHYWSIFLHSTLTILLFLLTVPAVLAQGGFVQAYVSSVKGKPQLSSKTRPGVFTIKRMDKLEPGSTIKTDDISRVVISLGDRSQITVLPNSVVVLKDYPAASSVRELLYIVVGRVIVKIHHIGGKPNPYRLNSPAASIAVRGTEFIVDVLQNGETLVVVREGQVEVWPHSNPGNKRLITPGGSVIVRPGGDISLAFPGPGGELNGRVRFNRDLAGEYQRSVDSLVQGSINILPMVFTAFPDLHLDSLENPAYAAEFEDAEGRLTMLPSVSKPDIVDDEENHRLNYSISPQLTFYTPIPGTRLTVGGSVSAMRTRLQNLTDNESPNYFNYYNDDLRFDASNYSITAAYNFGASGRTSAGISIDKLSGTGSFLNEYRVKTDEFNDEVLRNSSVQFNRTRLTFGLFHKFSESKKLGVYYRQGINSSNSRGHYHRDFSGWEHQFESFYYSTPPINNTVFDKTDISTLSSEVGLRYRARMTRRLFYGFEGSYLYERINTRYRIEGQPLTRDRDLARRVRLGVGTGFILNSKTILSLDFTVGRLNTSKPSANIFVSSILYAGSLAPISTYDPLYERGNFLSGHGMIQTNPWRNLFVSASSLSTFYKGLLAYTYTYDPASFGASATNYLKEKNYITNIGIGWRFKPNLIGEYLLSLDHSNRRPSHSLMLRYTFNLNIKGEK
jgi:FecR protein